MHINPTCKMDTTTQSFGANLLNRTRSKNVNFCSKACVATKETIQHTNIYTLIKNFINNLFVNKKRNVKTNSNVNWNELAKKAGITVKDYKEKLFMLNKLKASNEIDNETICLSNCCNKEEIQRAFTLMLRRIIKAQSYGIEIFSNEHKTHINTIIKEYTEDTPNKEILDYLTTLWNDNILYPDMKLQTGL